MATKAEKRRDSSLPLTVAEILERDNVPTSKRPPTRIAAQLSHREVHLSVSGAAIRDIEKALHGAKAKGDLVSLSLPSSVFLGQAGNTSERVTTKSLAVAGAETSGKPLKPEWAAMIYHPKLGAKTRMRPLRNAKGRRIVPLNNQSFIYGPDDRAVFYPAGYPWHCIGKVDVYPNATADNPTSWGSGVLIGDRLVLTAGHVPPVNPPPGTWKMRFTAGMYNGSPVDGAGAVSYVSDFKGYLGGVSGVDYAVLRLYNPLGTWLGYYGWKTYDSGWNGGDYWWLAGYPFDIAGAASPSYQAGIPVLDDDSDSGGLELEHHGDTASGDSGGPFWGFWDDGPYVVGTTSGHETISGPSWTGGEDNNIAAGGGALSNLLSWARSNWP